MNVVMMGTGTFAEPTFQALLASPHKVIGLVTQPDRAVGAERGSTRQTGLGMKGMAQQHGIPIFQPESVNTSEGIAGVQAMQPELLVVAAYGQILSKDVLAVPPHGGINVHASLLPKYRGAAPVAWAIYHGEKQSGVTIIRMSVALDAGEMLAQEALDIGPDETAGELEARLSQLGAAMAVRVTDQIAAGTARGIVQDKSLVTKAPKLTKEHGLIDWARTAEQVCCQIYAMQPWPTAYSFLHRASHAPARVIITKAVAFPVRYAPNVTPGALFTDPSFPKSLFVAAGLVHPEERSVVEVVELQPAGKRKMSAEEFLRGNKLQPGDRFGAEGAMKPLTPKFRGARHTARSLALEVLLRCHDHDAFVQELLDQSLSRADLSAPDRRLATQLAYGVLRRRGTLDALLRPLVTREPSQVERWLWDALRLGAYQLLLLTHIPPHAAVNETVELAAAFGMARAKGFINGVLRSLLPLLTDDRTDAPAADALPLERGVYRRLARAVLPDPAARAVEYLSAAFALPRWLSRRWLERDGWDECVRRGFWFAGPAPLWLRVNPLRIERRAFMTALAEVGIAAEKGEHPQAVKLLEHVPVRSLPGYEEGWFSVQDASAMAVAMALAPKPGMTVLDLCAAPGGKTAHLAELMRNQGRIVACDADPKRLANVSELCARLGVNIVETLALDPERTEPPPGPFDAVLVDVPCSNTGVLGRRPEARWRLRPEDLQHLVQVQTKLLLLAAERVKPGGAAVYSTCSIEPEENGAVVRAVLQGMRELKLEEEASALPGLPADGGYWARLRRKSN